MKGKLNRYAAIARILGIVLIIFVLGVVIYQVYDFYTNRLGLTPTRAVETYFNTLAQGNYTEVYRLTAKDRLTDIYGRPVTEAEFVTQLQRLTGDRQVPFTKIEVLKLCDVRNARYYTVTLHSSIGGATGQSHVIVEVRRQDGVWMVTYPFPIVL
jgi:hypothetical protein